MGRGWTGAGLALRLEVPAKCQTSGGQTFIRLMESFTQATDIKQVHCTQLMGKLCVFYVLFDGRSKMEMFIRVEKRIAQLEGQMCHNDFMMLVK